MSPTGTEIDDRNAYGIDTSIADGQSQAPTKFSPVSAAGHADNGAGGSRERAPDILIAALKSPLLHVSILIVLVWACFGRTLTGAFFIADDPAQVAYVHRAITKSPHQIWLNLTGNYMQVPGMNVWRPCLFLSLVADYLVWKTNSFGYYLTNLLYFAGNVALIYLLARQLTVSWGALRSSLAALIGASWFALSPLRCESVSWVVGRVDVISCFYYLAALLLIACHTQRPRPLYPLAAAICFWPAILTKEMAIGLPVIASSMVLFFARAHSLPHRLRQAAASTWPLWLSLVAYFALRYVFIGTIAGGYTAGLGASQWSGMAQRWADLDTVRRIFFPFNAELYPAASQLPAALAAVYLCVFLLTLVRLAIREPNQSAQPADGEKAGGGAPNGADMAANAPLAWLAFLSLWIATAIAPLYQLWGLGPYLEGSRFYWFVSIPLSLLMPVLLLAPWQRQRGSWSNLGNADLKVALLGGLILIAGLAVMGRAAFATNLLWVHAGKEVSKLIEDCRQLAATQKGGQRLALLAIPKDNAGAHMLLNGREFAQLLMKPFAASDYADSFITFDPILFGPFDRLNAARFRDAVAGEGGAVVWTGRASGLIPIAYPPRRHDVRSLPLSTESGAQSWQAYSPGRQTLSVADGVIRCSDPQEGDGVRFSLPKEISPLDYDFLEFELYARGAADGAHVCGHWSGESPLPEEFRRKLKTAARSPLPEAARQKFARVRIRLSQYWSWFCFSRISSVAVGLPPCAEACIRKVSLVPAADLVPGLSIASAIETNEGVVSANTFPLELSIDCQVAGAREVELQIGKPNFFFENFQEDDSVPVDCNVRIPATRKRFALTRNVLQGSGYRQIRARVIDKSGKQGEFSDAITLEVD